MVQEKQNTGSPDEPSVSLVIPVYNAAPYLRQCLDSVIGQTWNNLEIICVNDGSVDESLAILREYADRDSRFRIYSKENEGKGAAPARNLGLSQATGEYIQFVDSDDFFEPDMVECLVKKASDTGAEVVICRGQIYDHERGRVTGSMPHPDLQYAPGNHRDIASRFATGGGNRADAREAPGNPSDVLSETEKRNKQCFNWRDCPEYICEIADFYAWNKLFKRTLLIDNDL